MIPYWVDFKNRASACVDGKSEDDARTIASEHGEVSQVRALPYHARPVLNPKPNGETMTLCHSPAKCAGRTACPQRYACSE